MDPRPWDAEIDLPPERAADLVVGHFPEFAGLPVEPLDAGWDNSAFLVGDSVVFRFPRKASAVALLEAETAVLPLLGPRLPLPIPVPEWTAPPRGAFPWPFAGYRRVPGVPAARWGLSDGDRSRLAPELGAFLAALHRIPVDDLPLVADTMGRLRLGARAAELEARLARLVQAGVVPDSAPWLDCFHRREAGASRRTPDVVVHGDLDARHVLLDPTGRPSGVIDWGDVHRGDPAADLMITWALLPAIARPEFFGAYGPVDADTLALARRRAVFHTVAVAWYALEVGRPDRLREARRGLDFVLQD